MPRRVYLYQGPPKVPYSLNLISAGYLPKSISKKPEHVLQTQGMII
jgi:hypothetical protein